MTKFLALLASALALACCSAAPALAQSPIVGKPTTLPAASVPVTVIYCDDGSGHVALCSFAGGGGGGGTGDASAANQSSQIAAANLTNTRLGDVVSPAMGSANQRLSVLDTRLQAVIAALGTPLQAGGSVTLGGTLPSFASTPTVNIGTGGAGTTATPIIVDSLYRGSSTDRGGVFGTTSTQLMPANAVRRGLSVQVQGSTGSCYINGQVGATTDYHSLQIPAGNYWETPDGYTGTGPISIICTAASMSVYARER